jgi:shikimate kinase
MSTVTLEPAILDTIHASVVLESNRMRYSSRRPDAAPTPPSRIVLTGFMGAGKSTIGALLAAHLGWEFVDLDALIESRVGQSVPSIFAAQGEAAFRHLETQALTAALGRDRIVLALGGGAPEQLANRLLIEQTPDTVILYLHAPLEVLTARCHAQPNAVERPVLNDAANLARRFAARQPHYRRLATHIVDTTTATPQEIAAQLSRKLIPAN